MKSVFVGNLPYAATEDEIKGLFAPYGEVLAVKLVMDRETNRPRGFGFVKMNDENAVAAIQALDGQDFGGRKLHINEARERTDRPPRNFDGPRGGGRKFNRGGDRPARNFDRREDFQE